MAAALSHMKSRRMYSWWWDSHVSPKNSKWLQDNLTDMDSKVKAMIKLIEEDADSFAKRAEMYYKKRPELMKLVEEFYRAYRALAERYDHATVVIRQAHRTMSEAFPNQDPSVLVDDTPVNSGSGDDPETPEMSTPPRALVEADDLQSNGLELSSSPFYDAQRNEEHTEVPDIIARIKGSNPSNNSESANYPKLRVRKSLSFQDEDRKEQSLRSDEDHQLQVQAMGGADQVGEPEEILNLKKALAEVKADKEAGLVQYQQSLEKLSKLESEISHAQQDSQKLSERASTAEAEVQRLKEALAQVEAEKDTNLLEYHQCLDKISSLEKIISQAEVSSGELNLRASKAESEAQSLRDELEKVTSEKDSALDQYVLSLEKISNLENRLEFAEEDARRLFERAEKAENQIEALKQEISKLSVEKEVAAIQYKKCVETISSLENKLSSAREEVLQLRSEVDDGVAKLKGAEEQCLLLERSNQSLQTELESLTLKVDAQDQELTEKQKELGRLWTCIQEEHLRFVEAETAFQTLQQLHAKTQEEIQSLALDLEKRVQILKDMESHNKKLQDEVWKVKEENMTLNELNVSSAVSIKSMQNEISLLKETKGKLQEEVELRLNQRNALQQELYCLKEELKDLNKNHLSILDQVHAIGLSPECLKSSVKELQDENMNLKQSCERERIEKEALRKKLEIFGQLLEKNSILENSLSDLSAELEAAKGKIKALEESCQSLLQDKSNLLDEKTSLGIQLQAANENLGKLSENNTVLEKSLSDAHDDLYTLQAKLKSLEDSCQLLSDEKAGLASENDMLGKQLESTRLILEELERRSAELEGRYVIVEKEKASALCKMEELQVALDEEKQEHAHFAQVNETRLAAMQSMMHLFLEEYQARKREFEIELDRALHSEIEIFVLQRCALDLKKTNLSVLTKYQNLIEASTVSENVISELQKENVDQQKELKSLSRLAYTLRKGMLQLLKALDLGQRDACQENDEQDIVHLNSILHKIEDTKRSFGITEEENQKLALEKTVLVTLLQQLIFEYEHLETEKISTERELKIQSECSSVVKGEALRFQKMNEELKLKLSDRDQREEALVNQVENLQRNLLDVQGSLHELQRENLKIVEEKRFLTEESFLVKNNNNALEEENHIIIREMLSLGYLSLILKDYVDDRTLELKELNEYLGKLHGENGAIRESLNSTTNKLGEVEIENISLREMLQKSKDEVENITAIGEKLRNDILLTRDLLHEEQARAKIQEEFLQHELQKQMNEVEIWETQAAVIFGQLQTSTVSQVIYEQKVHELMEACSSLEYEHIVKDSDIKLLSESISTLTSGNESFNVQLAAYGPAVTALRECITSLESKTLHRKLQKPMNEEFQDDETTNDVPKDHFINEDRLMVTDASSASQDLQNRVRAIEKTVVEMEEQLVLHENLDAHSQLEAALRQIEELKSENSLHRRNLRPKSENSEAENALMTKDIMLDQVSECSSYAVRREQVEFWETADQDDSIGLTVGKVKKMVTPSPEKNADLSRLKSIKKKKLDFPASDALLEKDLSVDKLEISKKSMGSVREGSGRKVLQRLNSDVQKLTNLHITVQDLKMKVESTEKSRKVKAIDEFDTLKGQLEEAEATILKLLNLNGKLMKSIEDNSSDTKSSMDSEDTETVRRRRTSEQARRVSEKIGRLQLEVQKIQFILLKLDDEKESKGKTSMSESRRRVLLKDYLYGGTRIGKSKRKKAPFCGCVQSPAQGD